MISKVSLFVIGHSPAIILETLVARHMQQATVPNKVSVVTTASGAKQLKKAFFEQDGWQDFCAVYPQMKSISFSEGDIIFTQDMEDIRSLEENANMATLIFQAVRDSIANFDRLDASLAGGRKTMGYYLGLAMNLFGRDNDALTHVLIPPEWERDVGFLFPSPNDAEKVQLVDVPFIRLRQHLPSSIRKLDVETLVHSAQHTFDAQELEPIFINIKQRKVRFLGKEIVFKEREFSMFLFFVRQKSKHCLHPKQLLCGECRDCFLSYDQVDEKVQDLLDIRALFGGVGSGYYDRFEKAWLTPRAAQDNLSEPLNRIKQAVEETFGLDVRGEALMIKNIGKRGKPAYGLLGDKAQIREERG